MLWLLVPLGSEHPAHAKMQPYNDLPKSLLLEAGLDDVSKLM